ncbi:MAG: dTDP-glucose 4,6-dehydratase [Allomuricauda sp.]|nr:MAG: dTDP-glucose 4,6-dehydratase [Allomuricauda sp.]
MGYKKSILVTGGAGFIGSNFIRHYLEQRKGSRIVNLDKLTYAGDLANLDGLEQNPNYTFIKGDICDLNLVNSIFNEFEISAVIHFAAESHVDNSIENADDFIKTNIEGTYSLLKNAQDYWLSKKAGQSGKTDFRFHHVSTDEVYGSLEEHGYFTEKTPYAPNSPYSASKASSDFLVRSFHHTYGMNTVVSNCSNNYGPNQHFEKLIPTIIRKALSGDNIPIYGDGKNIRDWLYVEDHCRALNLVFEQGTAGETYLVGGDNEKDNLTIATTICGLLDKTIPKKSGSYTDQITFVTDRPGHDFRYAVDFSKIKNELGWNPKESFDSGLHKTIAHYSNKFLRKA